MRRIPIRGRTGAEQPRVGNLARRQAPAVLRLQRGMGNAGVARLLRRTVAEAAAASASRLGDTGDPSTKREPILWFDWMDDEYAALSPFVRRNIGSGTKLEYAAVRDPLLATFGSIEAVNAYFTQF